MIVDDFRLQLGNKEYVPIVIGGMGVDISTPELALSASRLGGIGHISDAMNLMVSDKRYGTNFTKRKALLHRDSVKSYDKSGVKFDLEDVYQGQLTHVRRTMEQHDGPGAIWINIMEKLTMGDPTPTLKARLLGALDGGIEGITLSAGLHTRSLRLMADHHRFRDVKVGIIVSSLRALKIFLKTASQLSRLPDYIIVEGPLAGGHLGFGEDWKKFSLSVIVDEVLQYLEKNDLDIPVIPAGGIFTGTDASEFLSRGAGAVQVATRFTITQECGLPAEAKQRYLGAQEEDVVVSSVSPTGYPIRMLKTSPCLERSRRPMCEAYGYVLSSEGKCQYIDAYRKMKEEGGTVVKDKICLCDSFSKNTCYTCGHYVYRLKDTTVKLDDGGYYLPTALEIFHDYQYSSDHRIARAAPAALRNQGLVVYKKLFISSALRETRDYKD